MSTYKPHLKISRTTILEAQILEKNKNKLWRLGGVVLLQSVETNKNKQSQFRNTDIEVVAVFHIYQV